MARIVGHLPVEELEARYRASHGATQARHLQAIWPLARGRTVLEVAGVLALVPRWVTRLAARYDASGPEALGDRRRRDGGTASLLAPELLAALAERLERPPGDGGPWSGPEAAAWMARRLGLAKVRPQRGREALKRLEWSVQAPRPRRHPRSAGPEQRGALEKSWTRRSRGPRPNAPTTRSRSGPRTSAVSA